MSESAESGDLAAERVILDRAIGGWRGLVESGAPTAIFITAYSLGQPLTIALAIAVCTAVVIAAVSLVQRRSVRQSLAGLVGVGIAAAFSAWTGRPEDFFLPGIITNALYGTAFLVSILVGWPLLGVIVGVLTGRGTTWRGDTGQRRVFAAASWVWVALFFGRLVIQVPLYLTGAIEALGVTRIALGWPAFLAAAYLTYRILAPTYRAMRAQA